ncbi:hypothetical protein B0H13DRAFT_2321976 [Mycena leptocephala]|nr:hypothetical protein B0H13DRAFT_2321976 [Mycena leptocephala]
MAGVTVGANPGRKAHSYPSPASISQPTPSPPPHPVVILITSLHLYLSLSSPSLTFADAHSIAISTFAGAQMLRVIANDTIADGVGW